MINKKDLFWVAVIGGLVGLLAQPIILNNIVGRPWAAAVSPLLLRFGVFIFFLVLAPVALSIAGFIGKKIPALYQFAKFAAVGALNTFVDIGVFNLEAILLGAAPSQMLFFVMKSFSFLMGTTNSYVWNKFWTFQSKTETHASEAVKFYTIAIGGYFLNVGTATLVYGLGGANPSVLWATVISPLAGVAIALFWDFFGYKLFVFKGPEAASGSVS